MLYKKLQARWKPSNKEGIEKCLEVVQERKEHPFERRGGIGTDQVPGISLSTVTKKDILKILLMPPHTHLLVRLVHNALGINSRMVD